MGLTTLRRYLPIVYEFLGSFTLLSLGSLISKYMSEVITFPLSLACLYSGLILLLAPLSGCTMNPSVVLCEYLMSRRDDSFNTILTITSQLLGGYLGGLVGYAFTSELHSFSDKLLKLPTGEPTQLLNIFIAESAFSGFLTFFQTRKRSPTETSILVFCMHAASWISINTITGGALNPSIVFGSDLSSSSITKHLNIPKFSTYMISHFFGSILAALANQLSTHFLWSELLGTLIINTTITCAVTTQLNDTFTAFSIALIYASTVHTIGCISGGYYNAAVSIATVVSNNNRVSDVLAYLLMQYCGALCSIFVSYKITHQLLPIHNVLEEGDKNGQILMLCILFSITLMVVYSVQFVKFIGDPPSILISIVYLLNYLWSHGKSEINPTTVVAVATLQTILGLPVDTANLFATIIAPIGGSLFAMAMLKNASENRRVDPH